MLGGLRTRLAGCTLCLRGRAPEGCREPGPLGDADQQFLQPNRDAHEVPTLNGIQVDAEDSSP